MVVRPTIVVACRRLGANAPGRFRLAGRFVAEFGGAMLVGPRRGPRVAVGLPVTAPARPKPNEWRTFTGIAPSLRRAPRDLIAFRQFRFGQVRGHGYRLFSAGGVTGRTAPQPHPMGWSLQRRYWQSVLQVACPLA